jgi:hypothetical protein
MRFLQRDPIGFAAGDANVYRYVSNGPTGRMDPSGLEDFAGVPQSVLQIIQSPPTQIQGEERFTWRALWTLRVGEFRKKLKGATTLCEKDAVTRQFESESQDFDSQVRAEYARREWEERRPRPEIRPVPEVPAILRYDWHDPSTGYSPSDSLGYQVFMNSIRGFDFGIHMLGGGIGSQVNRRTSPGSNVGMNRPVAISPQCPVRKYDRFFVGTPGGVVLEIPKGYVGHTARNGKGSVFSPKGQDFDNNSGIIRHGDATSNSPEYFRYYNQSGQPLDPRTGNPGPNANTHIPPNFVGPLRNYPGRP